MRVTKYILLPYHLGKHCLLSDKILYYYIGLKAFFNVSSSSTWFSIQKLLVKQKLLFWIVWWHLALVRKHFACETYSENIGQYKHSHKKQKDSLKARAVQLIFSLELEISGVVVQSINQNIEKWWLCGEFAQSKWLWCLFSYFLLLWPWCQGFWGSSEDRCRLKKVSQMLLVCYNLLNSQNMLSE